MMCDWRAGERTYVQHVHYCYPRSLAFLILMSIVTFVTLILEIRGVV